MVKVKNYHVRQSNDGDKYISLELEGDVSFVQSQNTGRFYATTKRCFMYAALDEATAKSLIGTQMPGTIERVACDPYEYTVQETGEVKTLSYTYEFRPADAVETAELTNSARARALA
jgi:hypothetical protein